MEDILSKAMHRRIDLLNLLRVSNQWFHLDDVADKIACSPKTVITDCEYIEGRWPDIVAFETSQKFGVRLVEAHNRSIYDVYVDILRESDAFRLLEAVFFEPGKDGEYWTKKFFLSNSSLYRISKKVDQALQGRSIKLDHVTYEIQGEDERQVRYFFSSYFYEVYGIHGWPFKIEKEQVRSLVDKIDRGLGLGFNDIQFMELAFSIAVTVTREVQGYNIKGIEHETKEYLDAVQYFHQYTYELQQIVKPFDFELPDNWAEVFTYSLFWWKFGWDNSEEKERLHQLGEGIIQQVCRAFDIVIEEKSIARTIKIFENIYAQHKIYPYKKYIVYNRKRYSSHEIQQNFSMFTAVVQKILKEKEVKTKFPWYNLYFDEILYELMVRWEDLAYLLEGKRSKVKIGIFSDLGPEHAQLLASFLTKNFGHKIDVSVQEMPYHELRKQSLRDFELYVTNFKLENIAPERQFIVEDIPTLRNLLVLRKEIECRRVLHPEDIPFLRE